jgi:hypothetical protein
MEKLEKKEISSKTAVKGLINGFVAYGILILFIFLSLIILVSWGVNNNKENIDYNVLKYTLPVFAAFLIFFLIRGVCKLSTFDLFKKCKIKEDDIEKVSTKMNFFYIICIAFFVFLIIVCLLVRFNNEKITVQSYSDMYYELYDEDFAEYKTTELIEEYETTKSDVIIQTMLLECGLLLGIFSLIPTQKKLIEEYNG